MSEHWNASLIMTELPQPVHLGGQSLDNELNGGHITSELGGVITDQGDQTPGDVNDLGGVVVSGCRAE